MAEHSISSPKWGSPSLGNQVQQTAIRWNNSKVHTIIGPIGGRAYAVFVKPGARVLDVAMHIFLGFSKVIIGTVITMPVQLTVYILSGKNVHSNWTVKQGLYNFGYAVFYTVDIFISPVINLINPDIYPVKRDLLLQNKLREEKAALANKKTDLSVLKAQLNPLNLLSEDELQKNIEQLTTRKAELELALRSNQAALQTNTDDAQTAEDGFQERKLAYEEAKQTRESLEQELLDLDRAIQALEAESLDCQTEENRLRQERDQLTADIAQQQSAPPPPAPARSPAPKPAPPPPPPPPPAPAPAAASPKPAAASSSSSKAIQALQGVAPKLQVGNIDKYRLCRQDDLVIPGQNVDFASFAEQELSHIEKLLQWIDERCSNLSKKQQTVAQRILDDLKKIVVPDLQKKIDDSKAALAQSSSSDDDDWDDIASKDDSPKDTDPRRVFASSSDKRKLTLEESINEISTVGADKKRELEDYKNLLNSHLDPVN